LLIFNKIPPNLPVWAAVLALRNKKRGCLAATSQPKENNSNPYFTFQNISVIARSFEAANASFAALYVFSFGGYTRRGSGKLKPGAFSIACRPGETFELQY
jgi:hypothetical protein